MPHPDFEKACRDAANDRRKVAESLARLKYKLRGCSEKEQEILITRVGLTSALYNKWLTKGANAKYPFAFEPGDSFVQTEVQLETQILNTRLLAAFVELGVNTYNNDNMRLGFQIFEVSEPLIKSVFDHRAENSRRGKYSLSQLNREVKAFAEVLENTNKVLSADADQATYNQFTNSLYHFESIFESGHPAKNIIFLLTALAVVAGIALIATGSVVGIFALTFVGVALIAFGGASSMMACIKFGSSGSIREYQPVRDKLETFKTCQASLFTPKTKQSAALTDTLQTRPSNK